MKIVFCITLILFSLFSNILQAAPNDKKIILAADIWCPYVCDAKSDRPGFVIEWAQEIFKAEGIGVSYKNLSWARANEETMNSKIHGEPCLNPDEIKEAKLIGQKESLADLPDVFWVKKGNPWRADWKNVEKSLQGLNGKVGLIKDYDREINPHATKLKKDFWVNGSDALEKLIIMLKNDRVGTIVEDPYVFAWTVAEMKKNKKLNESDDFEIAGNAGTQSDIHIGFCPKCQKFSDIFEKGLIALKKSGRAREIQKRYGMN